MHQDCRSLNTEGFFSLSLGKAVLWPSGGHLATAVVFSDTMKQTFSIYFSDERIEKKTVFTSATHISYLIKCLRQT